MVDKSIFESVEFFEEFSDEMIERLSKLADLRQYQEGQYLNRGRRSADYLYSVRTKSTFGAISRGCRFLQ